MKTSITIRLGVPFVELLKKLAESGRSQAYHVEDALNSTYNLGLIPGFKEKAGRKPSTEPKLKKPVKHPEYCVWMQMKQRCYNPNSTSYKYYGARGISVCEEWRNSFETFLKDVGPRPSMGHELDRVNNDGNYEPSNCRWATHEENSRNTRVSKLTKEQVMQIKELVKGGETDDSICAVFNISKQLLYAIKSNRVWKSVVLS